LIVLRKKRVGGWYVKNGYIYIRVRGGAVGGGTAIQAGRLRVRFPMTSFWPHYGPGVDSASNTNDYQE
jgi:hypothetical protein